jgi:hypothetical protein
MAMLAVPLAGTMIFTPFIGGPFRPSDSSPVVIQHAKWSQDQLKDAPGHRPGTTGPPTTWFSSGAFPSASNTGVPAGVALKASGSVVVSQAGSVIDGLDITGDLQINASNVTVKNTRIHSKGWVGIRIKDNVSGVVIQDVEINGSGTSGTSNSNGVWGPASTYRANIYGFENPFVPGSGSIIQDNYVHDLGAPAAPHYDGIQIDGGQSNIVIRHNTILNGFGQTAAVMIDNYFGPISNITVDNNHLAGGGFTVYSDDSFNSNPISGVSFTKNRMGKGQWGYAFIGKAKPTVSGNVDDKSGATISFG